jgi:ATP-dependent Lon protease
MTVTGNLKEVMKESISAASVYVRAKAPRFGIKPPLFDRTDVHVHVPEGATPKDGPSAGIAMVTAISSVLTGVPDPQGRGDDRRGDPARSRAGHRRLKEKLLAALRSGIKTVLIPSENEKDLADIPENVKSGLKIIPVSTVDEVLIHALVRELEPIEWTDPAEDAALPAAGTAVADPASEVDPYITH